MIRNLAVFIFILIIYYALRTVFRSALQAYHREDDGRRDKRLKGDEMVLDPECRTYVLKDRATMRRVNGGPVYFCSEACAKRFAERTGG